MPNSVNDSPMGYQDIRVGLRERITMLEEMELDERARFAAEQEKAAAAHKQKMDGYKATILSYRRLLELEEGFVKHIDDNSARIGPRQAGAAAAEARMPIPPAAPPLSDFICSRLQQFGPLSKEQLRSAAKEAGYFGPDSGGRQTHATLVNNMRSGRINFRPDGLYEVARRENALF